MFTAQIPTIQICDAICGAGKTSAAINMIKASDATQKFLYITPYLDEVKRIKTECKDKHFVEPQAYGSKLYDIEHLLNEGHNIVSTHALFQMFNQKIIDIVRAQEYVLIMDEVANVVDINPIAKKDLEILLTKTKPQEDGLLVWTDKEYDGQILSEYKRLVDLKALYYYSDSIIVWSFPVECFKAFRSIYVLTYMFNAQLQRTYYDFFNLKYQYIGITGNSVDNYRFCSLQSCQKPQNNYSCLIHILDNDKLNDIGSVYEKSLSKSWYLTNIRSVCLSVLKKNTYNFFHNITKTPSNKNLWTTFKDFQSTLGDKGYAKGFLSCNARATNAYRERTALAYLINYYPNPVIENFFNKHNAKIDTDGLALSTLIQWIFRSAIREGKEIDIYLPSLRMRLLLQSWIKCQNTFESQEINENVKRLEYSPS